MDTDAHGSLRERLNLLTSGSRLENENREIGEIRPIFTYETLNRISILEAEVASINNPNSEFKTELNTLQESILSISEKMMKSSDKTFTMIFNTLDEVVTSFGNKIQRLELDIARERNFVEAVLYAHGFTDKESRQRYISEWNKLNADLINEVESKGANNNDIQEINNTGNGSDNT